MVTTLTCSKCSKTAVVDPEDLADPNWSKGFRFVDASEGDPELVIDPLEDGYWLCGSEA